jgi:hypothetical protein
LAASLRHACVENPGAVVKSHIKAFLTERHDEFGR